MRPQAIRCVLFALGFSLLCAVSTSCGGSSSARSLGMVAARYVVFVDRSLSPGTKQTQLWTEAVQRLVLLRLQPGDALTLYEVRERTAETPPLKDVAIPMLDSSSGMDETLARTAAGEAVGSLGTPRVDRPPRKKNRLQSIPRPS